eukprot:9991-Heterococcus_DN1.PRE.4
MPHSHLSDSRESNVAAVDESTGFASTGVPELVDALLAREAVAHRKTSKAIRGSYAIIALCCNELAAGLRRSTWNADITKVYQQQYSTSRRSSSTSSSSTSNSSSFATTTTATTSSSSSSSSSSTLLNEVSTAAVILNCASK